MHSGKLARTRLGCPVVRQEVKEPCTDQPIFNRTESRRALRVLGEHLVLKTGGVGNVGRTHQALTRTRVDPARMPASAARRYSTVRPDAMPYPAQRVEKLSLMSIHDHELDSKRRTSLLCAAPWLRLARRRRMFSGCTHS